MQTLERTAYHEAGHAVVRCALSPTAGIGRVTIKPDPTAGTLGSSQDEQTLEGDGLAAEIAVLFAGAVAEQKFDPDAPQQDVAEGASDDFENAENWLRLGYPDDADRVTATLTYRTLATATVNAQWHSISAVAERLLEVETIDGQEVKLIVELANGDPDAAAALAFYRRREEASQ